MLTWKNTTGMESIQSTLTLVKYNPVFNVKLSKNNPAADSS